MKTDKFYFFTGRTLKELRRKKSIREKRKISQHIFANEISRPYGTVATWESKGVPKVEDAVVISEYYNVALPNSERDLNGYGTENMISEPDMPFITAAAAAVIDSLNKIIESKEQIIAEKERVIALLQEKLEA